VAKKDDINKRVKDLEAQLKKSSQTTEASSDQVDYAKKLLDATNALNAAKAESEALDQQLTAIKQQQIDIAEELTEEEKRFYKAHNENAKAAEDYLNLQKTHSNNLQEHLRLDLEKIKLGEDHLKLLEKRGKLEAEYEAQIKDSLGFLDTFKDKLEEIPVIGSILAKPIDDMKKKFVNDAMGSFQKSMKASGEAGVGMFAQLGMAARSFTAALLANPVILIIAAAVALIAYMKHLVDLAFEMDKHTTDISNNLNISRDAAEELEHSMKDNNLLFEEIVKHSATLNDSFGEFGAKLANDVMPRMQEMQFQFQLSDEQLSSLVENTLLLNESLAGTTSEASNFETTAFNTTKAIMEQLNLRSEDADVMMEMRKNLQDIASIDKKTLALYGKQGKALMAQVMTVRKLGLSMEQVANIAEGVLDIESSLEDEMTTNVLLGTHMNLNALRRASLFGDAEDIARETNKVFSDQNITLESFNDILTFRKKQLAETMHMGEDEIQMMLLKNKIQDKDVLKKLQSNKATEAELKNTNALTAAQVEELMLTQSRANAKQKLERVQELLTESINANMPGIQSLIKVLADFGTRASEVGLLRAMAGGGESAAEKEDVQAKNALSEKQKELEAAKKSGTGVSTALQEEVKTKAIEAKKTAIARQDEEETKGGSYATLAATGATIGTFFGGPIGTAIGAGVGLLFAAGMDAFEEASIFGDNNRAEIRKLNEAANAAPINQETAKVTPKVNQDFIYRPGQPLQSFAKGDLVMGMHTDSLNSVGSTSSNNTELSALMKEQNKLLSELITKVDQPVKINMGGKVIDEIDKQTSLRRTYTSKVDNGYNRI
jgi:hypothetical protein